MKPNEWSKSVWGQDKVNLEDKICRGECDDLIGEYLFYVMRCSSESKLSAALAKRILSIVCDEAINEILDKIELTGVH